MLLMFQETHALVSSAEVLQSTESTFLALEGTTGEHPWTGPALEKRVHAQRLGVQDGECPTKL